MAQIEMRLRRMVRRPSTAISELRSERRRPLRKTKGDQEATADRADRGRCRPCFAHRTPKALAVSSAFGQPDDRVAARVDTEQQRYDEQEQRYYRQHDLEMAVQMSDGQHQAADRNRNRGMSATPQ